MMEAIYSEFSFFKRRFILLIVALTGVVTANIGSKTNYGPLNINICIKKKKQHADKGQ